LRRSIDRHLHEHRRPEIGNAERQDQKEWGKDRGFDGGSGPGTPEKSTKHPNHFVFY
jgi:hypothetical protein